MTDRTWRDASAGTGLLDARPTDDLPRPAIDALRSLEVALTAPDPAVVAKVNAALGFRSNRMPNAHRGETATYLLEIGRAHV